MQNNEVYNLIENTVCNNFDEITKQMEVYGYEISDIAKITNYIDLANLLEIDSRLLQNFEIEELSTLVADLLDTINENYELFN